MLRPRIGVVGATGAVGRVTLELLGERGYDDVRAFASSRSAGTRIGDLEVEEATLAALSAGDLDLCLFGSRIESGSVTLPDPDLLEHAYTAAPIAELDPDFRHPVTGEPMGDIARRLRKGADLTRRDDIHLPGETA